MASQIRFTPLLARALLCATVAIALGGCGKESPEKLIASAQEYTAKGEHSAAVIQLKNALQLAPDNAQARLLLGIALLRVGDPAGAEQELRRAAEMKQPEDAVAPALAQALFELREGEKLLKEFTDRHVKDPQAEALIRTYVGETQIGMGQSQEAAASFGAALQSVPNFAPARLGKARLAAIDGRFDDALRLADAAIAEMPKLAAAYLFKAQVLAAQGHVEGAKATLHKSLEVDPKALGAHFMLSGIFLETQDLDAASAQIEAARKVARGDPRLSYFDALLALRRGDATKARESVLQVLKAAPTHVPSLVLAGAIESKEGQFAAAEDYLRRALARAPNHVGARRLLVSNFLRQRQPARAQEVLQPIVASGMPQDAGLLMLAGETYLANGDVKQAAVYYQAARDTQQAPAAQVRLGQLALARGDEEVGFRELEAAAQTPGNYQADLALVAGYLQKGDSVKTLAAAQALVRKEPKNPVVFQVLGSVQVTQKDVKGARESFEKALTLAPTYLPAANALAGLDVTEKKLDAARGRYQAMLEKDPKNEQIVLALAQLESLTGSGPGKVVELLQKAISTNPQSVNARLALVNFHLRQRDTRSAVGAARDAAAALPKDARVIEKLAATQEASGEYNQAIESLHKLIALQADSAAPLLQLAALHAKHKEHDRALEALQRAHKLAPENRQVDFHLVAMYLAAGRAEAGLKHARDLQLRDPKGASGFVLEGDVHGSQKRFDQAALSYREGLNREPGAQIVAAKLIGALFAGGKTKEAEGFSTRWLAEHPRDAAVRLYLGDRALRENNPRAAASHYQAVVSAQPNHVIALNNLAYVSGELGDPKALGYAERAFKLAPESAAVLDTLGVLLVKNGQTQRGLEHLDKARTLAPDRRDIQLNHARALAQAGQKVEARKALETLVALPDDTPEKAEAAKLLNKL